MPSSLSPGPSFSRLLPSRPSPVFHVVDSPYLFMACSVFLGLLRTLPAIASVTVFATVGLVAVILVSMRAACLLL